MNKTKKGTDQGPTVKENGDIVLDQFKNAKRFNTSNLKVMTDLFKLQPAIMIKNVGIDEKRPNLMNMEHCHFYRTYDSGGKKHIGSNMVGGHYHEIKVSVNDNGEFVCECSPPLQHKKSEKIYKNDNHVHNITYVKSEEVELRKYKPEAIKAFSMGMEAPKTDFSMPDLKR